jgi:hypothetical protein
VGWAVKEYGYAIRWETPTALKTVPDEVRASLIKSAEASGFVDDYEFIVGPFIHDSIGIDEEGSVFTVQSHQMFAWYANRA